MRKSSSPTASKECLRITQFRYKDAKDSKVKKPQSGSDKPDHHIPIRTLVEKMSSAPEPFSSHLKQSLVMGQSQSKQQNESGYKKFLTPRDSLYVPKPQFFNRYNYENYNGYEYKNPFRQPKYPIEDHVLGKNGSKTRNNPSHGTQKNLEIVFCEHKYQDFVKRTNQDAKNIYQEAKRSRTLDGRLRQTNNELAFRKRRSSEKALMVSRVKKGVWMGKKRTTLSNYLQQFNTLQKLSNYMEREHKLNEKYLFSTSSQNSRTVLLDIVIHRFQFLKAMKKKPRQLIFEILLGIEQANIYYKINIQEYIRFNQLFVSRDAEQKDVAMFMFSFLFKQSQETTKVSAMRSLSLLQGSAKLHQFVEEETLQLIEKYNEDSRKIFAALVDNAVLLQAFINLILEHG